MNYSGNFLESRPTHVADTLGLLSESIVLKFGKPIRHPYIYLSIHAYNFLCLLQKRRKFYGVEELC